MVGIFVLKFGIFVLKVGVFFKDLAIFFSKLGIFSGKGRLHHPFIKSVISFFTIHPYILIKTHYNQPIKNDRTSPHPPFSRAFQVPSQSAFRAHNAILVFYE